jgi:hypothetical protein
MRVVAAVAAVVLVSGCGSSHRRAEATPAPTATSIPQPAEPVIYMSRMIGEDPMVDDVTVGTNRWVQVRRLRGGAGGRFDHYRLTAAEFARVRQLTAQLGARPAPPRRRTDRWYYHLRLGPHPPYQYLDREIPARARPALRLLNRLIDISSQRDPLRRTP